MIFVRSEIINVVHLLSIVSFPSEYFVCNIEF